MSTTSTITAAATAVFCGILLLIAATAGAAAALLGPTAQPSKAALADIPAAYLTLYQQAATVCPGLDWTALAAIGKIETDHGRSTLPGIHNGENTVGAGVISGSTLALRHVRHVGDTPRVGEVSAGCES